MSRSDRDRLKRACAQAVQEIEIAQSHLAVVWQRMVDDGRPWRLIVGGLPREQVVEPTEGEMSGADVINAPMLALETIKEVIGDISGELWNLTLDDLKSWR